jgi:molybdopterin converting factor small subunit
MRAKAVTVRVQLFAWLREDAATGDVALELPAGGCGTDARTALARRYPVLAGKLDDVRLAINEVYQPWETKVSDGDILSLVPPVSGG